MIIFYEKGSRLEDIKIIFWEKESHFEDLKTQNSCVIGCI